VVEHEGRLLCNSCLERLNAPPPTKSRRFSGLRSGLMLAASAATLWFAFYYVATLLCRIPQEFHDATIWQEISPDHSRNHYRP
jgi:hypothetical protein